jgi:hypothetical protein
MRGHNYVFDALRDRLVKLIQYEYRYMFVVVTERAQDPAEFELRP